MTSRINSRNLLAFSFLLFGAAKLIFNEVKKDKVKSFFKTVDQRYNQEHYAECEDMLLSYIHENAQDVSGWTYLGTVYLKQRKDSLAKEAYQTSQNIEPNAKSLTGLGVIERNRGNLSKAQEFYEKAIDVDPNYGKAYSSLLIIELSKRNFQRAVELGEKGLELDSLDLGIKGNLMVAYHFTNKVKERDMLLLELQKSNYRFLDNLRLIVSGDLSLDQIFPKH